MTSSECISFSFATQATPGRDPSACLRELNDRNVVFRLDPLGEGALSAEIAVHARPELRILSGAFSGVRHGAAPEDHARAEDDELLLASALSGTSILRQKGREIVLTDGEAVILRRGDGRFAVTHARPVRFLGLRLPRSALAPFITHVDDAVLAPIPRDRVALRLLSAYVTEIARHGLLAVPDLHETVVRHVYELVALTLNAAVDGQTVEAAGGVRAARLQAVQRDVLARLEDPKLTVSSIAVRHRVTPRYIHKLFERSGSTFSEFVIEHRLRRAHRMLTDPRFSGGSISALAFSLGFGDLSYFNRRFRRRYGMTPSEVKSSRARRRD
jgi:AraC-like DNA-binding protein